MTTLPATVQPKATERKAVMMLGNEQVAVRLDEAGFLSRTIRTVRLTHGIELYHAGKGRPGPDDKVAPFQPGYMRLVAAMGGQLVCPPAVHDPVTGTSRPNPYVETTDNGIIRRVTATAVCVVRNPLTGEQHASVQTITVDAEHILRTALLNIQRDEIVTILSGEDIAEDRAAGKLRGKLVLPLTPPFAYLVADASKPVVREALATYLQQSATIRQRACSKAERLAADHNPITRRTWLGSQLKSPEKGGGAPYADVDVVAWVESRGREQMDRFVSQLASGARVEGVETVTGVHEDNDLEAEIDAEIDEARALPDRGEPERIETPPSREPVPVERTPERQPERTERVNGTKVPEMSPAEIAAMRARIEALEAKLPDDEVPALRRSLGETRPVDRMDGAGLRRFLAELTKIAEDLGVAVPA